MLIGDDVETGRVAVRALRFGLTAGAASTACSSPG
jgi:hypothetical protein